MQTAKFVSGDALAYHRRMMVLPARRLLAVVALACAGCTSTPERIGSPAAWIASPNYNERRPNFVILHHTTNDTAAAALRTLTDPAREVSAHYLIARDGTLYQLVDERHRAWHAGQSYWGGSTDLNSTSIGIELDNNGDEPFPQAQIDSLLALLADVTRRHSIPAANVLGHADIAPGRKVDPSAHFPWRILARHGYGLWCEPPLPPAPEQFDAELGLRALGYDVSNRAAAISAFKLHFVQDDVTPQMGPRDRDMLYCLLEARVRGDRQGRGSE